MGLSKLTSFLSKSGSQEMNPKLPEKIYQAAIEAGELYQSAKEGSPRYRRGLYLTADVGRQWDPQLAKIYYDQMVHKGNCHTQAVCAVATYLPARIHVILKEDRPYELRELEGNPISKKDARRLIQSEFTVPEEIRQRTRSRKRHQRKREGNKRHQVRDLAELLPASRFA